MRDNKEKVGEIAVDAGIVMVGDPCYHLHAAKPLPNGFKNTWHSFVDSLRDIVIHGNAAHQIDHHMAVVVGGFGGDGVYPVYIRRRNGLVTELVVVFDGSDEEEG
jgi:hypothetical protein